MLVGDVRVDTTQGFDKGTTGRLCSLAVTTGFEDVNRPSIAARKLSFGLPLPSPGFLNAYMSFTFKLRGHDKVKILLDV